MGLIRGALLFVVTVLLFLSFLFGNLFLTFDLSLDYNHVGPELTNFVNDVAINELNLDSFINERFSDMELYCINNSGSEFVLSGGEDYTFVIPCDIVSQGSENVVNYSINNLAEEIYYKEYNCDFWDCFEKTEIPFFLVSAKAKDYWKSKFYFSLLTSLVLIGLMFLLVEKKFNLPVLAGILLALASLLFIKVNWLLSLISDSSYMQLFSLFFSEAYTVFLITFITGLILLVLGLILKFFKFGFWVSGLFGKSSKKEDKPAEKKEASEDKEDKTVNVKEVVKENKEGKISKGKDVVKEKKVKEKKH